MQHFWGEFREIKYLHNGLPGDSSSSPLGQSQKDCLGPQGSNEKGDGGAELALGVGREVEALAALVQGLGARC